MPMTYEQINDIITKGGGPSNIHCIINDAGSRIILETIEKEEFRIDKEKNCLTYPTYDDGDAVLVNICLDSIADVRMKLKVTENDTCGSFHLPPIEVDYTGVYGDIKLPSMPDIPSLNYSKIGMVISQEESKPITSPSPPVLEPEEPPVVDHPDTVPDAGDHENTENEVHPQPPTEDNVIENKPLPESDSKGDSIQPTPLEPAPTKPLEKDPAKEEPGKQQEGNNETVTIPEYSEGELHQ